MQYRRLGKTGYSVSEVSFGSWAIGGTWGPVEDSTSMRALDEAIDQGINFFDTADVYGDGHSEKLLSRLAKSKKERIYIATKAGRRLDPHVAEGYTIENITAFLERSLKNLDVEQVDLLQLHCPPTAVYDNEALFFGMDQLVKSGKIAHYGVSVETVDEALKAITYENVATVQIIFNMFRLKPTDVLLEKAMAQDVGVIARVPLASGMLTGKMRKDTIFDKDDHRFFNRHGEAFDKGETFSGVDYNKGLEAVERLMAVKPTSMTMAQFALKWILMNKGISCVIPGGRTPEQVRQNAETSEGIELDIVLMNQVKAIYDELIRPDVHHLW
ncbi:MAG: aldo/keto reductase [Vallitaleaceae bacterium]|jgi:aryl-alcohol dehydrogenase-like predicted oxidoreductase|nr:aldo/keto reductase [Vallitaleaceae bacterium]